MPLTRNPVVLFLATGVLSVLVIMLGTSELSRRAAADEAVADARATTELLARAVAQPELPPGLVAGEAAALDRFDRVAVERLRGPDVRRVKIWTGTGRIVYSDKTQLVGQTYPLGEDEQLVLDRGGSDAEISDLTRPENRYERGGGDLLEVYTRIVSPEGRPLLFEMYYSADAVESRRNEVFAQFRPITLLALGLVVGVATLLLWALTARLRRSAVERERLLVAAARASDAERVRIARDLHDGVAQDLAGASFAVSALARSAEVSPSGAATLEEAGASLRSSLRSLRSLMVEIYPPDLHADGLPAALDDLLAPAAAQGVAAEASVEGAEGAGDEAVALVWRVAQEAVRNSLRHAAAATLTVSVRREGPDLVLTVTDDGVGFSPTLQAGGGHLGLRGLASLARESGATLEVTSAPGEGTVVRLRVAHSLTAAAARRPVRSADVRQPVEGGEVR